MAKAARRRWPCQRQGCSPPSPIKYRTCWPAPPALRCCSPARPPVDRRRRAPAFRLRCCSPTMALRRPARPQAARSRKWTLGMAIRPPACSPFTASAFASAVRLRCCSPMALPETTCAASIGRLLAALPETCAAFHGRRVRRAQRSPIGRLGCLLAFAVRLRCSPTMALPAPRLLAAVSDQVPRLLASAARPSMLLACSPRCRRRWP